MAEFQLRKHSLYWLEAMTSSQLNILVYTSTYWHILVYVSIYKKCIVNTVWTIIIQEHSFMMFYYKLTHTQGSTWHMAEFQLRKHSFYWREAMTFSKLNILVCLRKNSGLRKNSSSSGQGDGSPSSQSASDSARGCDSSCMAASRCPPRNPVIGYALWYMLVYTSICQDM